MYKDKFTPSSHKLPFFPRKMIFFFRDVFRDIVSRDPSPFASYVLVRVHTQL